MARKFIYLITVFFLLALTQIRLPAQDTVVEPVLDLPWEWPISSDYGPRILTRGFDFHDGIDYSTVAGSEITPVEAGQINDIARTPIGICYIEIEGSHGKWDYLHIFDGTNNDPLPRISGVWEFTYATLINPDTWVSEESMVIIEWFYKGGNVAEKVLCNKFMSNRWIELNGHILLSADSAEEARCQGTVDMNEMIAPSGTSGGFQPHLDLRMGYDGFVNPLFYVTRLYGNDPWPYVTICNPDITGCDPAEDDYYILTLAEFKGAPFTAYVDSTDGYDVDKVDFWIYPHNDETRKIHLPNGGTPSFYYGGRGDTNDSYSPSANRYSDGTVTGVCPLVDSSGDGIAGADKFVFKQNMANLNLQHGEHTLAVRVTDVNGHVTDAALRRILMGKAGELRHVFYNTQAVQDTWVWPGDQVGPFNSVEFNYTSSSVSYYIRPFLLLQNGIRRWLDELGTQTLAAGSYHILSHTFDVPPEAEPGTLIFGVSLINASTSEEFDVDTLEFTVL